MFRNKFNNAQTFLTKKLKTTVIKIFLTIYIVAIVNPFDLNTDNMTRIEPFNLLMPRKVFFQLPEFHSGIKSKLRFNDYLFFFEKPEEAQKRIFEATGIFPRDSGKLESRESLDPKECENKLIQLKEPIKAEVNRVMP